MSEGPRPAAAMPMRDAYGDGVFRRRIRLVAERDGAGRRVRGELADDFHHFGVVLHHDGERVLDAVGEAVRVPWTTCPGSLAALRQVVGLPLTRSLRASARAVDLRAHCTHLFDLSALAIAHALRVREGGESERIYDVALPDRRGGASEPTLSRDGDRLLRWRIEGATITDADPAHFIGQDLRGGGFALFVERHLSPEEAEAASVMRRTVFIGLGRQYDFERIERASGFAPVVGSACHTFAAERVDEALRVHGSVRDFEAPEQVLARD